MEELVLKLSTKFKVKSVKELQDSLRNVLRSIPHYALMADEDIDPQLAQDIANSYELLMLIGSDHEDEIFKKLEQGPQQ